MKTTISHLPQNKQNELNKIALTIQDTCSDTAMVILFGSYARGNYKEEKDLKPDRKSGHKSDYDILVITKSLAAAEDNRMWGLVKKKCDKYNLTASLRIITHDIHFVNDKLSRNQYFFSDIRKEGCMLYDSKEFGLIEVEDLENKELKKLAKDYFEHWFERAESFLIDHGNAFDRNDCKNSAFHLHQATESAYKTILLVFTNYCPLEHCLVELGNDAKQYSSKLKNIFKDTEEKRFKLLNYAYIGARYDIKYKINKEDLEYLSKIVKELLETTEEICKEKINSF